MFRGIFLFKREGSILLKGGGVQYRVKIPITKSKKKN